MKRGVLLLLVGVTVVCWYFAPSAPSSAEPTSAGRPSSAAQRTTTTSAPPSTTAAPTTIATTVPETVTTTPAVATTVAAADATTRDDPAATRLRRITYGLVGLGGLVLVLNLIFWRVTRPALLLSAAKATDPKVAGSAPAAVAAVGTLAAPVVGGAGAPVKISASAFLATPAVAPGISLASGPALGTTIAPMLDQDPPPQGSPVIDAPAPLADIPLGAPKPLVGTDSAWIIEPESSSGLTPESPTGVDFPEVAGPDVDAPVDTPPAVRGADSGADSDAVTGAVTGAAGDPIEVSGIEVGVVDPAAPSTAVPVPDATPAYPAATQALISALSSIPDKEPTVIRFDDPPVERIPQRRPDATPPPPATSVEAGSELVAEARRAPSGAPGFDRIAKEATATHAAVNGTPTPDAAVDVTEAGDVDVTDTAGHSARPTTEHSQFGDVERVRPVRRARAEPLDDMALMASALSSLPLRHPPEIDDPDLPPVGEFYDQDLDPGDPPGRD